MYGCDVPQNDPHGSPSGLAGHGCCTRAVMIGVRACVGVAWSLPHFAFTFVLGGETRTGRAPKESTTRQAAARTGARTSENEREQEIAHRATRGAV